MDPTFRPSQIRQANVTPSEKCRKYLLLFLTGICIVLLILWTVFQRIILGIFFSTFFVFLIIILAYVLHKRRRDLIAARNAIQIDHTAERQIYVVRQADRGRTGARGRPRRYQRHPSRNTNTNEELSNYIYEYPPNSGNFVMRRQPRNADGDFGPIIQTSSGNNASAPVGLHRDFGNNLPTNPYLSNRGDPISYPEEGNTSNLPSYYQSMGDHNPGGGNLNDLKLYGLDDLPPSYGTVLEEKAKEVSTTTEITAGKD